MILFIYFNMFYTVCFALNFSHDSTGTALYRVSDNKKICWTNEEVAVLMSRFIFDDLFPPKSAYNIEDGQYTEALIEYFRLALDLVRQSTVAMTKHVVLMALADGMGGYIHHISLPLTKYAFYMGTVRYETVKKLLQLFNELKTYLKTDGRRWALPIDVTTYKIQINSNCLCGMQLPETNCDDIQFYERQDENGNPDYVFLLPFFDSDYKPNSIAVPFKIMPLRSVSGPTGAYAIVHYFHTVMQCLQTKDATERNREAFASRFADWIRQYAIPHVNDEDFYSAFGNVYCLMYNITQDMHQKHPTYNYLNPFASINFRRKRNRWDNERFKLAVAEGPTTPNNTDTLDIELDPEQRKMLIIAISVGAILFLLISICIGYFLYRRHLKSKKKPLAASSCSLPRIPVHSSWSMDPKQYYAYDFDSSSESSGTDGTTSDSSGPTF